MLKKSIYFSITILGLIVFFFAANRLADKLFPVSGHEKILVKEGEIKANNSLYSTLEPVFHVKETLALSNALSKIYDARKVMPGDKYKVYYSTNSEILKFIYIPSPLVNYVVDRSTSGFIVSKLVPEIETKLIAVKGKITSSLYEGMSSCGINPHNIMNFAGIFQWQIDFFTDVQPGDRFMMVYSSSFLDGEEVQSGSIEYAAYEGRAGKFKAIRFKDGDYFDYYDEEGKSLRKQFLKAPLNFSRISSYFSYRRMHPILKYVRPHLGIDYAAPIGTPISSIGSGKITFVGWKGGYGRTVAVRHNSTYTSQYAHLRRYAKGVKKGSYVRQGQVIGYVGSSGVATGPHLDFRIKKNGSFVNFLKLKFPAAKAVSKKNLKEFKKTLSVSEEYAEYLRSDYFSGKPSPIDDYIESITESEKAPKKR